jgi:signal transduction histidine kinase
LNNIGNLYKITKQYDKAIVSINESLEIRKLLEDSKGIVSCYSNLGDIYIEKKEYKTADSIFSKALLIGTKAVNCLPEINKIYLSYSNLYEAIGDITKALSFYKLYSTTKDSLYTDRVGSKFAELETKYKTLEQTEKIQAQQFQITKRNYWIIVVIGLLVFGGLIGYLFYRRSQLQQQTKLQAEVLHQQELATKAVFYAEEKERKRIASDLHDGVGQTMSAVKMNLSALQNELKDLDYNQKSAFAKAIQLVDNSCKEVRTVSHNMMPNALLKTGLADAIREFIHQIDNRIIKIDLYAEGLNEKLDSNTETVLYRVIQESVNNVIKHSGANHLDISLIKDSDGLSITIEDNGKGFDLTDKHKFEGIGLKNIQSRIQFLKGTAEWQSQPNMGTLVAIHIPL